MSFAVAYAEKFTARHMALAEKAMNIMVTERQVNQILYKKIDTFTEDRKLELE